jgi:hypothetical protein
VHHEDELADTKLNHKHGTQNTSFYKKLNGEKAFLGSYSRISQYFMDPDGSLPHPILAL